MILYSYMVNYSSVSPKLIHLSKFILNLKVNKRLLTFDAY